MANSEERKVPKLLNDRVDLRSLTIGVFHSSLTTLKNGELQGVELDKDNELIIFTNFGTITGDLLDNIDEEEKDDSVKNATFLHEVIMRARNTSLDEYSNEGIVRLVNDSGAIPLANVTITPYSNPNNPYNLSYFLLYPDQVIGFTIGKRQT